MSSMSNWETASGTIFLYDKNIKSSKKNERLGNLIQDEAESQWQYKAVEDLKKALEQANFVITSTQDPPSETFVHDLKIPKRYGIYQSVGDTVGPGGALRAMRSVPQYQDIADSIRQYCPDAWVINYSNPMSVIIRTLYAEYPGIKAIGICNEVYHIKKYLTELLKESQDKNAVVSEVDANILGINHFTWADRITWKNNDISELLINKLDSFQPANKLRAGDLSDDGYFVNNHHVFYDLLDKFKLIPFASDRHLAEFVPWYLEIERPERIHRWGFRLTPAEYRDFWERAEAERDSYVSGNKELEVDTSEDSTVNILRAISGEGKFKTNINYPNIGQMPALPNQSIVETNAYISRDNIDVPIAGKLPRQVRNIAKTHILNQNTLVEAGLSGDVDQAYTAFVNDPLITLNSHDSRNLFSELIRTQESYLEGWNLDSATVIEQ